MLFAENKEGDEDKEEEVDEESLWEEDDLSRYGLETCGKVAKQFVRCWRNRCCIPTCVFFSIML